MKLTSTLRLLMDRAERDMKEIHQGLNYLLDRCEAHPGKEACFHQELRKSIPGLVYADYFDLLCQRGHLLEEEKKQQEQVHHGPGREASAISPAAAQSWYTRGWRPKMRLCEPRTPVDSEWYPREQEMIRGCYRA